MKESALPGSEAVPAWVHSLGVAVWVSNHEGQITFMNQRAEELLGREAAASLGHPCHEVIAGTTQDDEKWCRENCQINELAKKGEEIEPYTMRVNDGDGDDHWLQLLVIPYSDEGGRVHLTHCAFKVDRTHIIESYLDKVAARTPVNANRDFKLEESRLSRREREVLDLLAQDQNLYEIAEQLGVSYYTVRNHVQHVLGKMGVHSTLEAVALYLLAQAEE